MICLKLPKLAVWPAKGACEAAALRSSCTETIRIESRKMRRIADFVIKSPPSADFGPARSVDGRHWNLAHCLGNTGGELLAFAAGLRATRWAAKGGPMLFMIVE